VRGAPSKSELYKEDPIDFQITSLDKSRLYVSCPKTMANSTVIAPTYTWSKLHGESAYAISLNIAPDGAFAASGGSDGSVRVWNTCDGFLSRDLRVKGHVAEVNVVQWFPSGKVLCTAASDYQIKIWSVENSKCVRTHSGHSQGVEGISMIGNGRNFVSCSSDGTARLWDAGKGAVSTLVTLDDPINNCHIIQSENQSSDEQLILLCCEDGRLLGYDVRQKQQALSIQMGHAVNCCQTLGSSIAIVGLHNGKICVADLRNTTYPLEAYFKNNAPIFDLHLHPISGQQTNPPISFWIANGEGDCSLFSIPRSTSEKGSSQTRVTHELSGVDAEIITVVTASKDSLFTTSRDGIRAYDLSHFD